MKTEIIKRGLVENADMVIKYSNKMSESYIGTNAFMGLKNDCVNQDMLTNYGMGNLANFFTGRPGTLEVTEASTYEELRCPIVRTEEKFIYHNPHDRLEPSTILPLVRHNNSLKFLRDLHDRVTNWNQTKLSMARTITDKLRYLLDELYTCSASNYRDEYLYKKLDELKEDFFTQKNSNLYTLIEYYKTGYQELKIAFDKVMSLVHMIQSDNHMHVRDIRLAISEAQYLINLPIFNTDSFYLEEMLDIIVVNWNVVKIGNTNYLLRTIAKVLYKHCVTLSRDIKASHYASPIEFKALEKILGVEECYKFESYFNLKSNETVDEEEMISILVSKANEDNLIYFYFGLYKFITKLRAKYYPVPSFESGYGVLTVLLRIIGGALFKDALCIKESRNSNLKSELIHYNVHYESKENMWTTIESII